MERGGQGRTRLTFGTMLEHLAQARPSQEIYDIKIEKPEELAELMAEYDYRLASGAHPEIQLAALLAQMGRFAPKK